jgi:hypothetical protein
MSRPRRDRHAGVACAPSFGTTAALAPAALPDADASDERIVEL